MACQKNGKTVVLFGCGDGMHWPDLDDGIIASPAIAGNELFIRGDKNLYCIGEK